MADSPATDAADLAIIRRALPNSTTRPEVVAAWEALDRIASRRSVSVSPGDTELSRAYIAGFLDSEQYGRSIGAEPLGYERLRAIAEGKGNHYAALRSASPSPEPTTGDKP